MEQDLIEDNTDNDKNVDYNEVCYNFKFFKIIFVFLSFLVTILEKDWT